MAGWSVCPTLTLSRAEDKEHDGADDVDQRRQVEHILPLLACRSLVRQRADRHRRRGSANAGKGKGQSNDLPGVKRSQVLRVDENDRHSQAGDRADSKNGPHGQRTITADVSGDDQ